MTTGETTGVCHIHNTRLELRGTDMVCPKCADELPGGIVRAQIDLGVDLGPLRRWIRIIDNIQTAGSKTTNRKPDLSGLSVFLGDILEMLEKQQAADQLLNTRQLLERAARSLDKGDEASARRDCEKLIGLVAAGVAVSPPPEMTRMDEALAVFRQVLKEEVSVKA